MPIPTTLAGLTHCFRELGADDPEGWARSQINESIPQLARCAVLRVLWNCVSDDDESRLEEIIDRALKRANNETTAWHLIDRCRQHGASLLFLNQLVRSIEINLLQDVAYQLDGGPLAPSVQDCEWAIFQVDENGVPFGPQVQALHESFISLDPTGREGASRVA